MPALTAFILAALAGYCVAWYAAIVLFFAAASCVPDKAPAVPVSGMAAEPDTEQDAAEAMPIAHGIYPDLPYEPTNEDLAAMQKTEFIGAGK